MTAKPIWWILWPLCGAMAACSMPPDEPCGLEAASGYPKDHPACLFYSGTDHYRNGRYSEAYAAWHELVALPVIDDRDRHLLAGAQSSLGYLLFNGLGTQKDKAGAIELWESAAAMGHEEAEYHLCHAYVDSPKGIRDHAAAALHCQKAQALYEEIADRTEAQESILKDIRKYRPIAETAAARDARLPGPLP